MINEGPASAFGFAEVDYCASLNFRTSYTLNVIHSFHENALR